LRKQQEEKKQQIAIEKEAVKTKAEIIQQNKISLMIEPVSEMIDMFKETQHWIVAYIDEIVGRNIIKGIAGDTASIQPDWTLRKVELYKMVIHGADIELLEYNQEAKNILSGSYADIDVTSWYAPYIYTAHVHGWVAQNSDQIFDPKAPVPRAEALKIMITIFDKSIPETMYQLTNNDLPFSDTYSNQWYNPYLRYALSEEIITPQDTFRTGEPIFRGETAKIILELGK
ncbi:MAG: S-layer homology domain-containing protein, partial [Patescibacteria group bacterium]|nr:S-layer homology domain-containing protein [Patescibacteria group bacterium]